MFLYACKNGSDMWKYSKNVASSDEICKFIKCFIKSGLYIVGRMLKRIRNLLCFKWWKWVLGIYNLLYNSSEE